MFFQLFSTLKVRLVDKMVQSNYLCVILQNTIEFLLIIVILSESVEPLLNPLMYTQSHTPLWYKGGGWADGPPPSLLVFAMLQYFETILPSVESL